MEHLGKLEKKGIVRGVKRGRERVYTLDWNRLIDEFVTEFVEREKYVTDYFLEPDGELAIRARAPHISQAIVRNFGDKQYLRQRSKLTAKIEVIMRQNRLVRDFIRCYFQSYSAIYLEEDATSLAACVSAFVDRFAMLVDQNEEAQELLHSKAKDREVKDFIRFLVYLRRDAYVSDLDQFVSIGAMGDFLRTRVAPKALAPK
jgi:hypothetical protein